MKILHTADWHLGQLFHTYDRSFEHQQFLDWLLQTLTHQQIDVLLISGDVFDLSNPAAATIRQFYSFLNRAVRENPALQIVITAGNHDSAPRLESPKPLLESSNIHIVGLVQKDEQGEISYDSLLVPLKDNTGAVKAWCLAIPFLRTGDYPTVPDAANPYAAGVAALYEAACAHGLQHKKQGQALIAMGHLHAQSVDKTDSDAAERPIIGGVDGISVAAFPEALKYVALGHIHRAQAVGGKEHIRYCGSPIPMSFSELNYTHQVVVFHINGENIEKLRSIEIPVSVPLLSVPYAHSSLNAVLAALAQLPDAGKSANLPPYLQVRVLLDSPEPALRHKIETALTGKEVRLARIDVKYPASENPGAASQSGIPDKLDELEPLDVFKKIYASSFKNPAPEELVELFNQIAQKAHQTAS